MASPVLKASTFDLYDYGTDGTSDNGDNMTVRGTACKAIICSLIVLSVSIFVHSTNFDKFSSIAAALIPLFIATAGFCWFLRYNPQTGIILAPVFSCVQGIVLGLLSKTGLASIPPYIAISCIFDHNTEAFMALFEFDRCYLHEVFLSSACIVIAMSLACISGTTQAKHSKALILTGDILGVLLFYMFSLLSAMVGFFDIMVHTGPGFYFFCGIFSCFLCLPVAYSLAVDFDNIRVGSLSKVPSYMEWYCAFALIFSLTWCYIEIFRVLIAMIRDSFAESRFGRRW